MKAGKLMIVLTLCILAGCSSKTAPSMEEIDVRLEEAGYTISLIKDAQGTTSFLTMENLDTLIDIENKDNKFVRMTYTDKTNDHQYVIDAEKKTEAAIIDHDGNTCSYDFVKETKQENPKECDAQDEQAGKKMQDDYQAFLNGLDMDTETFKEYIAWRITD